MQDVTDRLEQTFENYKVEAHSTLEEIRAFIAQHPYVAAPFAEAFPQIAQHFPNAKLAVQIVTDHEIPDDIQLTIFISPLVVEAPLIVLEKMRQFNRAWGFDAVDQSKGKVSISVRYF